MVDTSDPHKNKLIFYYCYISSRWLTTTSITFITLYLPPLPVDNEAVCASFSMWPSFELPFDAPAVESINGLLSESSVCIISLEFVPEAPGSVLSLLLVPFLEATSSVSIGSSFTDDIKLCWPSLHDAGDNGTAPHPLLAL